MPPVRPHLILASASPRRAALLRQVGIVPSAIVAPSISETPLSREMPQGYALRLASAKAQSIAKVENTYVLAADTVVACGRRILPKAESDEQVALCLALLSGRRHRVHTAIALAGPSDTLQSRISTTRVLFKNLSTAEIAAYVACGEGLGKAGGYAIQGRAEAFVRLINGSYSNVVGLPLLPTVALLANAGIQSEAI